MGYDLHITRKDYWADETRPDLIIVLEAGLHILTKTNNSNSNDYWIKIPGSETESQVVPAFCKWT